MLKEMEKLILNLKSVILNMLKAVKIRLYPNKTQEQTLNKGVSVIVFVYNQMLAQNKMLTKNRIVKSYEPIWRRCNKFER